MNRLKAFTLIELTIALLISAVVITIAYYTYSLFLNQYHNQQSKSALLREYRLFRKSLQLDIEKSDFISDSGSVLILNYSDPDPIRYLFDDNLITRISSQSIDSFHLKNENREFNYVTGETKLIEKVVVSFKLHQDKLNSVFCKHYSSQQLLASFKKHE